MPFWSRDRSCVGIGQFRIYAARDADCAVRDGKREERTMCRFASTHLLSLRLRLLAIVGLPSYQPSR